MAFDTLSIEIISKILLSLHFEGMLVAEGVCKTWKAIIDSDPNIQIQLFRRPTDHYVPPTAESSRHLAWGNPTEGKDVRLHPAINSANYTLSGEVEEASFYTNEDTILSLPSLSIAQDQFSIPSVKKIRISASGMLVRVDNEDGVKVVDFFRELANVSQARITDFNSSWVAEELAVDEVWGHPYYEGVHNIRLSNGVLRGECAFGS